MRKFWVPVGLSTLLVATNLWWAYHYLDFGKEYTFLKDDLRNCRKDASSLAAISTNLSKEISKDDFLAIVEHSLPDAIIIQEGAATWIDGIAVDFLNDKVSSIQIGSP